MGAFYIQMVTLQGPSEFKTRRSTILCDFKNPSILRATVLFRGIENILHTNYFSVSFNRRNNGSLDIYHRYDYLTDDNIKMFGRWYDSVALDTFRVMAGTTYTHTVDYEDDTTTGKATITLEFTDEATLILREAF
jgi:hypothetical protein